MTGISCHGNPVRCSPALAPAFCTMPRRTIALNLAVMKRLSSPKPTDDLKKHHWNPMSFCWTSLEHLPITFVGIDKRNIWRDGAGHFQIKETSTKAVPTRCPNTCITARGFFLTACEVTKTWSFHKVLLPLAPPCRCTGVILWPIWLKRDGSGHIVYDYK